MSAIDSSRKIAEHIRENKLLIIDALCEYETYQVASDELDRALDLLENLIENSQYFSGTVQKIIAFLPINQPLYALACFGIVPSLQTQQIFVRPPVVAWKLFVKLEGLLNLKELVPNLVISRIERQIFLNEHTTVKPNVVIFTGKPENAHFVQKFFGDEVLFIGNGASHNPIIVAEDADIQSAVKGVVEVQLYNQGADCAAPNAILVNSEIREEFLRELCDHLKTVRTGAYSDRSVLVGPVGSRKHFDDITARLDSVSHRIYPHGYVRPDSERLLIFPTIVLKPLWEGGNYREWLAPVFFIQEFNADENLALYFENTEYSRAAAYISLYGTSVYINTLFEKCRIDESSCVNSTLLYNTHLHAPGVERGTKPYGGYGEDSSFIAYKGHSLAKPTLPQRDIYQYLLAAKYDFRAICTDFLSVATTLFKTDLEYIFFSGSVAYGGGRLQHSDIDVGLVLADDYASNHSHEFIVENCIAFAKEYFQINSKHLFIPDDVFPGEFLTSGLISDAIEGRGFSVRGGKLYLPTASTDYYLSNINHWFRAWLSMTAFSVFGGGNLDMFTENKRKAWKTLVLYFATVSSGDTLSAMAILDELSNESNKWIGFGVTENYHYFYLYEFEYVDLALKTLAEEGYFQQRGDRYLVDKTAVTRWEKQVARSIENGSVIKHKPITVMEDIDTIRLAIS